jgi:predicted regulator of Ras-like GTPase activity (Roadblock/LC7/MglB family)
MPSMEETLHSLRDVDGVHGSFVIGPSGALVAKDLPAIFDGELFAEVGPRVARLYEAFVSGGEEMDACVLRFAEHKLYVRKMRAGMIGTISASRVNMAALRMVVNLVIRRLDPEMGRTSVATPALPRTPPPPPVSPPASQSRPPPRVSAPAMKMPSGGAVPVGSKEHLILAEDGRDPLSDRHVRMHRGRRVEE